MAKAKEKELAPLDKPILYVAIGASAGGLEAIEAFFSQMPADSGMAFIVVQHLSPDYKSLMVELLSKRTSMMVFRAENQLEIKANCVYLIPPKKNLTIYHGQLMLTEQDHSQGLNLPIDIFFNSLAIDQGEKAVAIVLSGTGSDGMRGVKAVKEAGGMIVVQDENTAKFDGMPRSAISTGLADLVLPPEEMPAQLVAYSSRSEGAPLIPVDSRKQQQENVARIFALLRNRTGVDFTYYKPSTIIRRLERRMNLNQINEIDDYARFIENFPQELNLLYKELLIGVTSFFRDTEAFDYIASVVIPELFKNAEGDRLRIWVAGCSSGEEAYSLAILFSEYQEKVGRKLDIKIFATDIDRDAIVKAGNGLFPESSAMEIGQKRVGKYFVNRSGRLQIVRQLREMVVFAQHNLIKDPPFTNIDLISCRNMLIYLQPILQKKAMAMFHFSLRPEGKGYLFLGSSETTGEYSDSFKTVERKLKIFSTIGKRNVSSDRDFVNTFVQRTNERKVVSPMLSGMRGLRPYQEDRILERLMQALADEMYPLIILVNEAAEIIYLIGDSTGVLKLPSGHMNNDIAKLATKAISIPLSTGLQKVFKKGDEVCYSNIKLQEGFPYPINLYIKPLSEKKGQEKLAIIFIRPSASDTRPVSDKTGNTFDVSRESQQRITDLEQELQFTKENLQATIEELETSNEELQATNEELLSANEELQSTNEELQSVNEELFTVNSEYQHKILELTELNNDIDNLLRSIEVGTIFLDENLEIRKFTPKVNKIIRMLEQDIGRPFQQLSHHIGNINLMEIVNRVQQSANPESVEYRSVDDNWYLIKVLPYKISPRLASGVVITFVDIDEIKIARKELAREQHLLRQTGELAKIGGWKVELLTGNIFWTDQIYKIYGIKPEIRPGDVAGQMSFYPPEVHEALTKALDSARETGEAFDLTLPFLAADDRELWVRIIGKGIKANGQVVSIDGTMQDITELTRLRRSLERANLLFESFTQWDQVNPVRDNQCDSCKEKIQIVLDKNTYQGILLAGRVSQKSNRFTTRVILGNYSNLCSNSFPNPVVSMSAEVLKLLKKSERVSVKETVSKNKSEIKLCQTDGNGSVAIPVLHNASLVGLMLVRPRQFDSLSEHEFNSLKMMAARLPSNCCFLQK